MPVSNFILDRRGAAGRPLEHWVVAFAAILVALLCLRGKPVVQDISAQLQNTGVGWLSLGGHLASLVVLIVLSWLPVDTKPTALIFGARISAGLLAVALAVFAFVPARLCWQLIRSTITLWLYAVAGASLVSWLVNISWSVWQPATRLTFVFVRAILNLFPFKVIADPTTATIGTETFHVQIGAPCSGLEGVGLMTVFSLAWLWFFRRECRFPRALLLIPAGLVTIWLANALRISALILIGNAGAPKIAEGGFHSQAGWIAFNAVALGFCLSAQYLPWVTSRRRTVHPTGVLTGNPTAAYLLPLLAILAAGMLSRAASSTLEWLYPVRFFAALAALWFFRSKYSELNWKFGWQAVAIGGIVFAIWLALDRFAGAQTQIGIGSALSSWPITARIAWLTFRILAAVVTVPIAEELAFRGFLIRRLISRDFESVSLRTFTYFSLLVSSVVFGLLHGDRWFAGILAGIFYAFALFRRGRIGDAVAAHATTNGLLAAWVLLQGRWDLW